jgi:hypothetical protein
MGLKDSKQTEAKTLRFSIKNRKVKMLLLVMALCLGISALVGCTVATTAPQRGETSALGNTSATAKYVSGAEVAFEMSWKQDSRCITCHATEVASTSDKECLAALHTEQTCKDCHTEAAALKKAHNDLIAALRAEPPKGLKDTEVTNESCATSTCHDMGAITPLTVNAITDKVGTQFNPHDLAVNEGHQSIVCADCHAMHVSGEAVATATETCESCHHDEPFVSCYTCHEENEDLT